MVPDERIQRLLAERTYVVPPPYLRKTVKVHAVDERWAKDKEMLKETAYLRQALLEMGLIYPEDAEFIPTPMTLGWE